MLRSVVICKKHAVGNSLQQRPLCQLTEQVASVILPLSLPPHIWTMNATSDGRDRQLSVVEPSILLHQRIIKE
jgi:hypothetical protein